MPTVSAQQMQQNDVVFYLATISGRGLLASSIVSWRHEDPTQGFNRALNLQRAREIARYLDFEKMSIPTNIVVSAQPAAALTYSQGQLSWSGQPGSFLVLDGQHRLYSMEFAESDYDFGVTIYEGLNRPQEVRLFIDVNTKQRGVPSTLLLDIKQLAGTETGEEETLRQWFDYVSTAQGSPLRGQTTSATTKRGSVSRTTFNSALRKVLDSGVMDNLSDIEQQGALLVNYLKACDRIMTASGARRNRVSNATMLNGLFDLFAEVVQMTMSRNAHLRPEDLAETMRPWQSIPFDSYVGSNNATKAKFIKDLRAALTQVPAVTADLL